MTNDSAARLMAKTEIAQDLIDCLKEKGMEEKAFGQRYMDPEKHNTIVYCLGVITNGYRESYELGRLFSKHRTRFDTMNIPQNKTVFVFPDALVQQWNTLLGTPPRFKA